MRSSSSASDPDGTPCFRRVRPAVKLWDIVPAKRHLPSSSPPGALVDSLIVARDGDDVCGLRRCRPRLGRNSRQPVSAWAGRRFIHWPSIANGGSWPASINKNVKLWDLAERKELATLSGHTLPVASGGDFAGWEKRWRRGRFLPKSPAGVVKLWDVGHGQGTRDLERHGHGIFARVFARW